MSPNPAGKKWVIAQSKISLVSDGSVRNAVWVSSQWDPTIVVICMRLSLSREKPKGKTEKLNVELRKDSRAGSPMSKWDCGEQRASARSQEVVAAAGARNVSATSWSAASSRFRSNGFGKMAIAPDPLASSDGAQPETRMMRALGSFARMLRQAVAPFSFGIQ